MPVDINYTVSVAVGDVDGDNDLDLVFGSLDGSTLGRGNRLYMNDGGGTFTDATAANMPVPFLYASCVALGDVDGDNDLDLVFGDPIWCSFRGCSASGNQTRLFLNDGTGVFTDATGALMPIARDRSVALTLSDLDGDGDPDLVVCNYGQQTRLLLNDGSGTFTDASATRMPVDSDWRTSLAVGDVDADGDVDLMLGNGGQNRLYLNLLRQLHAPLLLRVGHPFQLDAYARYGPPSTTDLAFPVIAGAPAHIPLPPFGTIGIDPATILAIPAPIVIPQPAGVGSVSFVVPNNPGLEGLATWTQALLIRHPVQVHLTNVIADVVRR
jgi:hypothetical protein